MVNLIQPTFSGGELSPSLYARVDIDRYGNSVAKATNFLVRPTGGLVNRPGFQYLGSTKSSGVARLIPFLYSTTIAYVLEFGNLYVRFWANGAQIDSGGPVEVVTPYTSTELNDIAFTQSADTMLLVHPNHAPRKLVRTSATSFVLSVFENRQGPFKPLNTDEAIKIASDKASGFVTITANSAIFTANHVGGLLYIEAKALGQVKPWSMGDRDVAVGTIRRSDGKTYKATAVASGGTWRESGGSRPIHESGREWDGPGDTRTDGTGTWSVGVQWEYQDSGYGIVKITAFTNSTTVSGEVVTRLPDAVVGGTGAAARTWNRTGDGATKTFNLTAPSAVSTAKGDYTVTIAAAPIQPDPYFVPPFDFYIGSIGGIY